MKRHNVLAAASFTGSTYCWGKRWARGGERGEGEGEGKGVRRGDGEGKGEGREEEGNQHDTKDQRSKLLPTFSVAHYVSKTLGRRL